MTVLVALLVCLIVLLVVGDEIIQRETVMGGHEIDAGPRPAPAMIEEVGGCADPRGKLRQHALIPAPIAPHRTAVAIVPLRPTWWKLSELIATGPYIPGLCDQLHVLQCGRLSERVKEAAARIEAVILAADGGRQVKAEAVDMHLLDPIG